MVTEDEMTVKRATVSVLANKFWCKMKEIKKF